MPDADDQIFEVLDNYAYERVTSTEALQVVKEIMARKLEPYIGEDFDLARNILRR